jgi:hypothetical protein
MFPKRLTGLCLFVGVFVLLAVPTANATDYGCQSHVAQYVQSRQFYAKPFVQTYTPTYQAPIVADANYSTDYATTLFRVAPELAYGRINEEIANRAAQRAVEQLRVELTQAEAKRQTDIERARQERILTDLEAALRQLAGRPGTPAIGTPNVDQRRLEEENAELRAILGRMQQQLPPAETPKDAKPIPKASNPPGGNDPIVIVQTAFGKSCLECHGGKMGGRMNLSDVAKLDANQLLNVQRRLITGNPKKAMPPPDSGHQPVGIEIVNAVDALVDRAQATK